jgi:hypothetical protein
MAKVHEGIGSELQAFLERQPMFFVASAPLGADGHVNVSPKGLDGTFAILGAQRVAYLDRLLKWADSKDDVELAEYRAERNATSINGLPAF